MAVTMTDIAHPTWCSPRVCRARIGGTHRSELTEVRYRNVRVAVWLQQRPGDEPILGWATRYSLVSGPEAYLPLSHASELVAALVELVDQARTDAGQTS